MILDGPSSVRSDGRFAMLIRAGLVLIVMLLPAPALAGSALPRGLVYLRDIDPTIVQDIRYAGSHNFVGRPIRGYLAAECILSVAAATALEAVQKRLAEKKLSLIVWDCYRPKRAVDDFLQWSKDPATPASVDPSTHLSGWCSTALSYLA